jgi:hypothetical protein
MMLVNRDQTRQVESTPQELQLNEGDGVVSLGWRYRSGNIHARALAQLLAAPELRGDSTGRHYLLLKAARECHWGFYKLCTRRRRNYMERRRTLVLRAVNIMRRFIVAGEPHEAVRQLDEIIFMVPNAVLLHAARVCALWIGGHQAARQSLLCYAGQRICGVRFENLILQQLHHLRKATDVSRIITDIETLLDCIRPSPGEMARIRGRLEDLAVADFEPKQNEPVRKSITNDIPKPTSSVGSGLFQEPSLSSDDQLNE